MCLYYSAPLQRMSSLLGNSTHLLSSQNNSLYPHGLAYFEPLQFSSFLTQFQCFLHLVQLLPTSPLPPNQAAKQSLVPRSHQCPGTSPQTIIMLKAVLQITLGSKSRSTERGLLGFLSCTFVPAIDDFTPGQIKYVNSSQITPHYSHHMTEWNKGRKEHWGRSQDARFRFL